MKFARYPAGGLPRKFKLTRLQLAVKRTRLEGHTMQFFLIDLGTAAAALLGYLTFVTAKRRQAPVAARRARLHRR